MHARTHAPCIFLMTVQSYNSSTSRAHSEARDVTVQMDGGMEAALRFVFIV